MTPFHITPTHSPPPPHPHIPDTSDIDTILFRNINKLQPRKPILVPTSIKRRRRHAQFDPSFPLPKPCNHFQPEISLPPPKLLKIPALDSLDTLSEKRWLTLIQLHCTLSINVFLLLTQLPL